MDFAYRPLQHPRPIANPQNNQNAVEEVKGEIEEEEDGAQEIS